MKFRYLMIDNKQLPITLTTDSVIYTTEGSYLVEEIGEFIDSVECFGHIKKERDLFNRFISAMNASLLSRK